MKSQWVRLLILLLLSFLKYQLASSSTPLESRFEEISLSTDCSEIGEDDDTVYVSLCNDDNDDWIVVDEFEETKKAVTDSDSEDDEEFSSPVLSTSQSNFAPSPQIVSSRPLSYSYFSAPRVDALSPHNVAKSPQLISSGQDFIDHSPQSIPSAQDDIVQLMSNAQSSDEHSSQLESSSQEDIVSYPQFVSSPPIPIEEDLTEINLPELARFLNCLDSDLQFITFQSLKRLSTLPTNLKLNEILSELVSLNDIHLFELFFNRNFSQLMEEVSNEPDFVHLVFACIKIGSINSYSKALENPRFPLNGPQVIIDCCMYGSHNILERVLEAKDKDMEEYIWIWKLADYNFNFMLDFGPDPFLASLFIGALKAVVQGHLNCLQLITHIEGFELDRMDLALFKEASKNDNFGIFIALFSAYQKKIPDNFLNEILLNAITYNCEELVNFLLTLDCSYLFQPQRHLASAIKTRNINMVKVILGRINHDFISAKHLNLAAESGCNDIFIEIVKVSSNSVAFSALCNCISDESFHGIVPIVFKMIKFTSMMISSGLTLSIRSKNVKFVEMFLSLDDCTNSSIQEGFLTALESNDPLYIKVFSSKYGLISFGEKFNRFLANLFQIQAWNSLLFITQKHFSLKIFPKDLFMKMVMQTDQLDIAVLACSKGGQFPLEEISLVKDPQMLQFVQSKQQLQHEQS